MAWIEVIPPERATGRLAEVYESIAPVVGDRAHPSAIHAVFSLLPNVLLARVHFSRAMTRGASGLGRRLEELISTQVASLLGCRF